MKNTIKYFPLLAFIFLLFLKTPIAQTLPAGPQVLSIFSNVDDSEQPYALYIPKNYDPNRKYPFVMMLHGAGSNHRLALKRVFGKSNTNGENDAEASRYFPPFRDVDYIVAAPLARGTMGYTGIPEKDVLDVLADVQKRFNIDEDRMYLTGLSMGGGGTLWIGLSHPDLWAAIAPVCPAPPKGTIELAPNALNFPVHFFHGDADPVVPIEGTRDWVKRFQELGVNVESTEFPGVQHDSWVGAYKDAGIFDWFGQFKRHRFPDHVMYNTWDYRHGSAYWVRFDEMTPGTLASIDAKFNGGNKLDISTKNLDAFSLLLKGHPNFKAGQALSITLDGQEILCKGSDPVSLEKSGGKWEQVPYSPRTSGKRAGAEGPIKEAVVGQHVFVYGTAGSPTEEELKARRDLVEKAAGWRQTKDFNGRSLLVFPRVISDREVKESDLAEGSLILFGTRETNSIIARYADQLPLELDDPSGEFGLIYIMPFKGHYLVVNSGKPYWEGFATEGLSSLYPVQLSAMDSLEDFKLFKGTSENVIAGGRFTNNWKLPKAASEKIAASGVVKMK
ncbi:MAG: prolyl oligopeptidase family serine peptidase [Lewinellaceae bacterium]|nr:prolyl oligopeptidase family serine peptidase [Saprospiraceae bacterium]MCB9336601.1 prolyl oligopeptidase family serine peptidase [Lewinellaceae bacterium]